MRRAALAALHPICTAPIVQAWQCILHGNCQAALHRLIIKGLGKTRLLKPLEAFRADSIRAKINSLIINNRATDTNNIYLEYINDGDNNSEISRTRVTS